MDVERYAKENRDERIRALKVRLPYLAQRADEKINYRLV
jgi:hypothetical protein